MNRDEINKIIEKIIKNTNIPRITEFNSLCCVCKDGVVVIEGKNLELKYSENYPNDLSCEIRKLDNSNPVVWRDRTGKIYRCNGEYCYISDELIRLSKMSQSE